jgi:hypothetical protein
MRDCCAGAVTAFGGEGAGPACGVGVGVGTVMAGVPAIGFGKDCVGNAAVGPTAGKGAGKRVGKAGRGVGDVAGVGVGALTTTSEGST